MASAGLEKEKKCSICLHPYPFAVTLRCGHNFCCVCINEVYHTRDEFGVYSCPECREKFQEWPEQIRNMYVRENFRCKQKTEASILCTYCVDFPLPAVKSCLHCEASLCNIHLRVHSKGPGHFLTDPRSYLETRKCSVHEKILEYYCTEDAAYICASCCLIGEHSGHKVDSLDEAFGKKKKKFRNAVQKLITNREKTERKVQNLKEHRRKAQQKASREAERVTALFMDIKRRVDDLEKRVLKEISRWEVKVSLSLTDVIYQLKMKKEELSRKMRDIEELCNMTDPLTVLQELDTYDLCDPEEEEDEDSGGHDGGDKDTRGHDGSDEDTGGHDGGDEDTGGHDGGDGDTGGHDGGDEDTGGHDRDDEGDWGAELISHISHTLSDIIRDINVTFHVQNPTDILLDVNTADNNLLISDDLKTVTWTEINQNRPETAERFQDNEQVMSGRRFTSGRHYWDVEGSESDLWSVGMCYPSIDRRGRQSYIGNNDKSWGLYRGFGYNTEYSVIHNNKDILLPHKISSDGVRIYLDYEAGQLSFYELCDPIRHLHTFTATFSEPLHAVLYVCDGSVTISGGAAEEEHNHQRMMKGGVLQSAPYQVT